MAAMEEPSTISEIMYKDTALLNEHDRIGMAKDLMTYDEHLYQDLAARWGLIRRSPCIWIADIAPPYEVGVRQAIADRVFPGGAVAFGSCTVPYFYKAYGTYTFESSTPVTPESLWDMASLTKVMVTTPSIMILYDHGEIELEELACKYLPEFGNNGKEEVTIYQLLTHTAGLREFYPFFDMGLRDKMEVLDYIMNDKLWYPAGGIARYSDLSMIVLGLIVERISGVSLDVFVGEQLFKPLTLPGALLQLVKKDRWVVRYQRNQLPLIEGSGPDLQLHSVCTGTMFRPTELSDFDVMIVPTEVDRLHRNRLLWGEVHDPTAFLLGGVAGHAGLFSTIIDVCKFARMMLARGMNVFTNRRLFMETTVQQFVTPGLQAVTNTHSFALGWDVALRRSVEGYTSAGKYLGPKTFGHTGLTGTSLWIDPDRDLFVALLTNAIHPTAVGGFGSKVREVRPLIADAAVLTMEQLSTPERSLSWQNDVYDGGVRYQALLQSPAESYWTNNDDIGRNFSQAPRSPPHEGETEKQTVGQDLQVQYLETESYEESSQDLAHNNVALERSVSVEGNLDTCQEPRRRSPARIVVPVFLIALFFSIIS